MDSAQQLRHVRFDALCILIPEEPCEQEHATGLWRAALAPVKSLLPQGWVGSLGGHARRTSSTERSAGEDGVLTSPRGGRSQSLGRRFSSSQYPVEIPRPCLKTSQSSQSSAAIPGAFPSSPPTSPSTGSFPFSHTHSAAPISPTSSSIPLVTEPLSECCAICNSTTDRAVQLGPAYRIPWTLGAAAKKKRDDAEEERDILDGFKSNCQAWKDVLPDEEEQDGYAKPYQDEDEEAFSLSDEDDDSSDSKDHKSGKSRVLSKLDGITASTPRHRRDRKNKEWKPDRYYDIQENEDDLFPLPSPVGSPRQASPNTSSSNLPDIGNGYGFATLPTIPGSLSSSRVGSDDGRSLSPSPLRHHIGDDDDDDQNTIGKAFSAAVALNSAKLYAESNTRLKPQPTKISIPPSSSQSSLVDAFLSPRSVLPSAHQLSMLAVSDSQQRQSTRSRPESATASTKPKVKSGPPVSPSIASGSSRSVSSTGSSGRMYQSGGFVPPPLPSGRRPDTGTLPVMGKVLLERAEGTGRSPLVSPNAPPSRSRNRETGRGFAGGSQNSGGIPVANTGHITRPVEPPNPKMPTYSAAQREVVVIASSRASGSTERGGGRQSSDTITWPAQQQPEKERSLPFTPAAAPPKPQRQASSNSYLSTDSNVTAMGNGGTSDRSDRTPSYSRTGSVDEFGRDYFDGAPLPTVETITPRVTARQTSRSQTLPTLPESGSSYNFENSGKPLPSPPKSRTPQNVLKKAGSGTDLRVNNQYQQQQSQRPASHHEHQAHKSLSPIPDRLASSGDMSVPSAPAVAGAEAHRSRSSSIRKLWRGVLGGAIGGATGAGGGGAALRV